jgi:hypothetical protein
MPKTPMATDRVFRAGDEVEDLCRACKTDRSHTVIVVDQSGWPLRVQCGFCQSQHNYRGGPRIVVNSQLPTPPPSRPESQARFGEISPELVARARRAEADNSQPRTTNHQPPPAFPLVSERERTAPPMSLQDRSEDLELLLRRIIREEAGITPVTPAQKWRGGTLILKPGTPGLQEKTWPIETFFHKVVMLRNRLRTLEQQVNASDLPEDVKVKLQGYVSGCYGSLTSFNVLFADEDDQFKGSGGD